MSVSRCTVGLSRVFQQVGHFTETWLRKVRNESTRLFSSTFTTLVGLTHRHRPNSDYNVSSTMRIFLTGATGYVGSAVLDALRRAGHSVAALVRDPEKAERLTMSGVHAI